MTKVQKIIKYLALAFAAFLIVNIVSGIFWGLQGLTGVFGRKEEVAKNTEPLKNVISESDIQDVTSLKIDLEYSSLRIIKGNTFEVKTNSPDVKYFQNGHHLTIKEKEKNWINFTKHKSNNLFIVIPETTKLERLEIDAGVGELQIDGLTVSGKTEIDGGVGELTFTNVNFHDLELDLGVGEIALSGTLSGHTRIEAGVGEVDINLLDGIDAYRFNIDKGVGSIQINGQSVSDNTEYGMGMNLIDIEGGIGEITIEGN